MLRPSANFKVDSFFTESFKIDTTGDPIYGARALYRSRVIFSIDFNVVGALWHASNHLHPLHQIQN